MNFAVFAFLEKFDACFSSIFLHCFVPSRNKLGQLLYEGSAIFFKILAKISD